MTKTILITGGSGFIGSHTCLALLNYGYNLIVLDSYINSSPVAIDRVLCLHKNNNLYSNNNLFLVEGDIRDYKLLSKIFIDSSRNGKPIVAVIHFAGLKAVEESVREPLLYWGVNVGGATNLFRVMNDNNCRTVVFSSSATIYAASSETSLSESSDIRPINPYGETKVAIEQILNNLYNSCVGEWRIANLRYFNPVGAHPSGEIGECPSSEPNNLFPYISQVAIGSRKSLHIFGNDWPTPDGTGVRDYIHVMDLAEAHCAALEYLLGNESRIINLNIGTGKGTSVLELLKTFEEVNGCKVPYIFSSRRRGDLPITVANNQLAIRTLNWTPKRSLRDICRDGWQWQLLNPFGYSSKPI